MTYDAFPPCAANNEFCRGVMYFLQQLRKREACSDHQIRLDAVPACDVVTQFLEPEARGGKHGFLKIGWRCCDQLL